jgi:hypothetical protein
MKKLCLILALLLTLSFSSLSITCYAKGGSVTVNGASAKAGDVVTVQIVANDVKGVNSGSIEVKSLPKGVTVLDGSWAIDAPINAFDTAKNRGVFALAEKGDLDGTVFKLKLKLGADAQSGDIVCELRFKDGSAGNPDVSGIENIPGKLTVVSASDTPTDDTPADDTPTDGGDTDKGDTEAPKGDEDVEKSDEDDKTGAENNDEEKGDEKKLSPIVIALIAVAGIALIAALVLIFTKKKK